MEKCLAGKADNNDGSKKQVITQTHKMKKLLRYLLMIFTTATEYCFAGWTPLAWILQIEHNLNTANCK